MELILRLCTAKAYVKNGKCGVNAGTYSSSDELSTCIDGTLKTPPGVMVNGLYNRFEWTCDGVGPTSTSASCTANTVTVMTNGECYNHGVKTFDNDSDIRPQCVKGDTTAISPISGNWGWTCVGLNGGTTATCSALKSVPPVVGCGSANGNAFLTAPINNLCTSSGVESNVVVAGDGWDWTCGGTSCHAKLQVCDTGESSYSYTNNIYNFSFEYCFATGKDLKNIADTVSPINKECLASESKCINKSFNNGCVPDTKTCSSYGGYSGVYVSSGVSDNYKNSARAFMDSDNKPVMVMRVWSVPRVGNTKSATGPFIDFEEWLARVNIGGTYSPAKRVSMNNDYIIYNQGNSYYFWSPNIDNAGIGNMYVYVLTYQEGGDKTLFDQIISNIKFNINKNQ